MFLKLRRRRTLQRDLDAELAFHREMAEANGNPIPLGNTTSIKEQALGLWRFTLIENLWRDVIYGVRSLRRSPALVITALASLALGIGVNTTIFSLGMEFLFSEPSVRDPGSLVYVRMAGNSHAKKEVLELVRNSGLFQDVVGENEESFINWNNGAETHRIFSVYTTKNYFPELGMPMLYGRGYGPNDSNQVAVLPYLFWRKHFNGDPSVVGRAMNLDGRAYTIVGILRPGLRTLLGFGWTPDVFVPRFLDDTYLAMYARLKPGMSLPQARAGIQTIAHRLDAEMPAPWKYEQNCSVTHVSGMARLKEQSDMLAVGVFFAIVMVVVGLVLLIACINVASLLLARASTRKREIAIRVSLGATRGRLFQQLFVDSLLLSVAGAALGLSMCWLLSRMLAQMTMPAPIPIQMQPQIDWRVAIYAAALTIGAAIACGVLPAWRSVKTLTHAEMARDAKLRLRRALVAAQVAVSVMVLATGFLFVRNLMRASDISPGFDVQHTLRAEVNLPPLHYKDANRVKAYADEAVRRLMAVPGIEAAAAARIVPFTDATRMGTDLIFVDTGEKVHATFHWNAVTPGFFDVMRIPLLAGRTFTGADRAGRKVVMVNRKFVEQYVGKRNPVGAVFRWDDDKYSYEIAGVVEGTKNITIGEEPRPQLYEPLAQTDDVRQRIQFVMRAGPPPSTLLSAVRRTLREVEPGAGLEVATLYSSIGVAFLPSQMGAAILGSLGVLGLVLAMIGLYGVMIYSVARRTHEIGIRMAIGASRGDIRNMVLKDSLKLVLTGSAIGIFVAVFAMRPMASFLVTGVKPDDPSSLLAVVGCLVWTGLLATWGPLRRATGVEPARSLRYE